MSTSVVSIHLFFACKTPNFKEEPFPLFSGFINNFPTLYFF
jgi:hypothetical protein